MTRYKVTLAPAAAAQALRIAAWWRRHRGAAPSLFHRELDDALLHMAEHPEIGRRADGVRVRNARVLLLRRTGYLIFYQVDASARAVNVALIRHARRRPLERR